MDNLLRKFFLIFSLTCCSWALFAQNRTVTGKVTTATDGQPMPGVNVTLKGASSGASTDADGSYRITIPNGKATLVFSFIGMLSQEVNVNNRTTINVELLESPTQLNEVVVTGYTTTQQKDVISSMTTIKSDRIKNLPVSGIDQALQGQAAGVRVSQSSGTPGGGVKVVIRGNTSINASNRPLMIVDGIPVYDGAVSQFGYGGQQDNAISSFNTSDVESIQVLKDASAKAIYGARGANGVVLITTKRGKANQKTNITMDVQRGTTEVVKRLDLLNSTEILGLQREALANYNAKQTNFADIIDPDARGLIPGVTDAVNTNWVDEVLRKGIYQQYQLSTSGGNDRTRFYLSGSYRDEEGVQLNNRFARYTGSFNLDHKASPKLSFGLNMSLGSTKNRRVFSDNAVDGVYGSSIRSLPYYSPFNEQGKLYTPNDPNYQGFPNGNPVAEALLPRQITYGTKVLGGINAEYAFLPNLRLRTKFSMDYNNSQEDTYNPTGTFYGSLPSIGGQGYGAYAASTLAIFLNSTVLTYNTAIGENHHISALLGGELLRSQGRSSSVQGRIFPRDEFTYIASAGVVDAGSSFYAQNGLVSGFGEVKYDYKDKYLFSATARYDGSSRFGQDRKFGFFPSVSAGWRLKEEGFLKDVNFLEDLKLRASYGFTGNERIGNFQFLGTWGATTYNGSSGVGPNSLSNPNLQWERTREANIGLDVAFWKGRLSFTAEVYDNVTDALLFAEPLPATTGFGALQGNIGSISNRGAEFTLRSVNFDGAFRWTTDLNLSRNDNKVVSLASDQPLFRGFTAAGVGATNVIKVGEPLGTFWGLKYLGVDVATGDALYDDFNGDGRITTDDAQVIGNAQPKLIGGLTNSFSWKGIDVSLFFQFSYGNKVMNYSNSFLLNPGTDLRVNQTRAALRRWQKPGDVTDIPRFEYNNGFNSYSSSRLVEDGSYLRLKNVAIGYTIPSKWTGKAKLGNVRLYATATNLWTLTRYIGADPEVSTLDGSTSAQGLDFFTLPQVKTLVAGVTVNF
ncbi:TonB-dependent receptor [Runella sp.]|uniref:SusC/RagA family TonB-linked outer membrane protein n=1 Tax=Runella sp. TaxID=1960881 RepID=UPI00262BA935|nr:TonB-dependent receptor [Runella sp.]